MNSLNVKKNSKGQGALEYLLLIGGAVLVATIVLITILGTTGSTNTVITNKLGDYQTHITLGAGGGGGGAVCGNGNVQSGEACDDGDLTNGDGCSSTCTVEPGYSCVGNPSVCTFTGAVCGNGNVQSGEACDDGDTSPGDGCDGSCNIESGWTCTGNPSVCSQSMAASFSFDWKTMDAVYYLGANPTVDRTVGWTVSNSSPTQALSITGVTVTFSASGVNLTTVNFGGVTCSTGSPVGSGTLMTANCAIPTSTTLQANNEFIFSGPVHADGETMTVRFDFSDGSFVSNTGTLTDRLIALVNDGTCTAGAAVNETAGSADLYTDFSATFQDAGLAQIWDLASVTSAASVAYASLELYQTVGQASGSAVDPTYFLLMPGGTWANICADAGIDNGPSAESGVSLGTSVANTTVTIKPANLVQNYKLFDVESIITNPSALGTQASIVAVGNNVAGASVGRRFRTSSNTSGTPPLMYVGIVS